MSKVMVIGANSSLAQTVIPVLSRSNELITMARRGADITGDISEQFSIPNDVDVVVNCAAAFGGDSDQEINEAYDVNVKGMLNICVAAKKAGVAHLVNISSLSAVLSEDSPYYTIYAITKKQADELAEFYCGLNGINLTTLRPSQIYGDDDSFSKHQPFFYNIIDRASRGEDIVIFGNHDAKRNYIHSNDMAEIIDQVITQKITGTFACMNKEDNTFSEIASTAQSIFGAGGKIVFAKDKPNIPDNVFAKDFSIFEKLNYNSHISIKEGITRIMKHRKGGEQ